MKKFLYSTVAVATFAVALASNAKAEVYPRLTNENNLFFVSGHAEAGIYMNEYWNRNKYNDRATNLQGPDANSGNTAHLLNVHNNDLQLNQAVLSFGKKLDSLKKFDIGGRVDGMFGTDARFVQSTGLERGAGHGSRSWGTGDYYSAIAQAYLEAGNKNMSVKAGKFLAPVGSNSIMSPDRFFYSLPQAYGVLPATLTGVTASFKTACDTFAAFAGWATGENETFNSHESNTYFVGGSYRVNDRLTIKDTFLATYGDNFGEFNHNANDSYVNSFVLSYKVNDRIDYTFENAYRRIRDWATNFETRVYSYNNELTYKLNDEWKVGGRVEYVHVYDALNKDATDAYSFVAAANYSPNEWLIVKPEVRYDTATSNDKPFDYNNEKGQIAAGISAIVKF